MAGFDVILGDCICSCSFYLFTDFQHTDILLPCEVRDIMVIRCKYVVQCYVTGIADHKRVRNDRFSCDCIINFCYFCSFYNGESRMLRDFSCGIARVIDRITFKSCSSDDSFILYVCRIEVCLCEFICSRCSHHLSRIKHAFFTRPYICDFGKTFHLINDLDINKRLITVVRADKRVRNFHAYECIGNCVVIYHNLTCLGVVLGSLRNLFLKLADIDIFFKLYMRISSNLDSSFCICGYFVILRINTVSSRSIDHFTCIDVGLRQSIECFCRNRFTRKKESFGLHSGPIDHNIIYSFEMILEPDVMKCYVAVIFNREIEWDNVSHN